MNTTSVASRSRIVALLRSEITWCAGITAALIASIMSFGSFSPQPAEAEVGGSQVAFGAHPSRRGGQDRVEAAQELQGDLGGQLDVVRRYLKWEDDATTDPLINWTLDQNSIPHISVVPRRQDGSVVSWGAIASAAPGSPVHNEIRDWANQIKSLNQPVWFTFNHEPETTHNVDKGVDSEFVGAWRNIVDVFRQEQVTNARYVWVMTAYAFSRSTSDRRHPSKWYPGDAWTDDIAADPYNWTNCRPGINNRWTTFEASMTPVRDFAAQHPDKGLMAAEFGSAEDPDDPGRKAEWVNEIRRLARDPEWSQLSAVIAFNAAHPEPGTDCEWWADSSPQTLEAYRGMLNDPVFGGNGDGPPPPPEDPDPTSCEATVVGRVVRVSWSDVDGIVVVRRDQAYVSSVPQGATSYTHQSPPDGAATYQIRVWRDAVSFDVDCGTVTVGGPNPDPGISCSVAAVGQEITVAWSDSEAREIVRRNGGWLASPNRASTSHTDSVSPGEYSYSMRTWVAGGGFEDVDCGSVVVEQDGPGPVPTCSVIAQGDMVTVTWENIDGKVVLRRNDAWRASPVAGDSSAVDDSVPAGTYDYTIRNWVAGGGFDDYACGTVTIG